MAEEHYLGNPLLKKANTKLEFTEDQVLEWMKCAEDPVYFAKNYIKIVTLDHGLQPFEMYPFQERMVRAFDEHRFVIGKLGRQSGKTTTVVSYLLHYVIFNDNVNVAILANKASTARDILERLQTSYENLPKWLQQGVLSWNRGSLELENKSKITAASTSASSIRGGTYNIIFLDEFAFVPSSVADTFFTSVYPVITSGKTSKVIIISCVTKDTYLLTDKGYRKMETIIDESKDGAYMVPWYTIHGRDKFYSSNVILNQPKSPTNIIKTRYETIECSYNHKLWAFKNGEYRYFHSEELEVGDYIALRYNQQVFGNDDYVGFYPEKGKSHNLFSCEYVNEDIAYFVGLYVSEGYARDLISKVSGNIIGGSVVITCGDDISPSLGKLGLTYNKKDEVHYEICSKQLTEFLKLLGFDITKLAKQKTLPDKVLSWSKPNIAALLRGMFDGDGCADTKGRVTYCSTSRELIRQVQLLLANMGMIGSIYEYNVPPSKKVKVHSLVYTIELTGMNAVKYFEEIGFGLKRKQDRIVYTKSSKRNGNVNDIVPHSYQIVANNTSKKVLCETKIRTGRRKTNLNLSRALLLVHKEDLLEGANDVSRTFLEDNVRDDLIWMKIKDIQKGEAEVYDVSLPDIEGDKWAHSVLYNNFLGSQTPLGMNQYYRLWDDAKKGKNEYFPIEVDWREVPGRDEEFKRATIANMGEQKWRQEFESVSRDTLVEVEDNGEIRTMTIGELYDSLESK